MMGYWLNVESIVAQLSRIATKLVAHANRERERAEWLRASANVSQGESDRATRIAEKLNDLLN